MQWASRPRGQGYEPATAIPPAVEHPLHRPGGFANEIIDRLMYRIGKNSRAAKPYDWLDAAILVFRDRAIERWMETTTDTHAQGTKRVHYLSPGVP